MTPYAMDDFWFVVAVPESERVETPHAYRMLDQAFDDYKNDDGALHEMLFSFFTEDGIDGMYNVFESVVLPLCPNAAALRSRMISLGAKNAMMSGSGSAVFAVFDSEAAARYAANDIEGAIVARSAPPCL